MFSMILSVVSLFSNSPFLISTVAAARPTALLWTTGGCKAPRTADSKVAVSSAWRILFFLDLIGGGGLEGLPFGSWISK